MSITKKTRPSMSMMGGKLWRIWRMNLWNMTRLWVLFF